MHVAYTVFVRNKVLEYNVLYADKMVSKCFLYRVQNHYLGYRPRIYPLELSKTLDPRLGVSPDYI